MKLTHASSYAVHAVVYMATEKVSRPIASHHIAEAQGIPERFLLKVLKPLVSAGVLYSSRGPNGGYALARTPSEITLLDIVEAVDGRIRGHVSFSPARNDEKLHRHLEQICNDNADQLRSQLKKVTIAKLMGKK